MASSLFSKREYVLVPAVFIGILLILHFGFRQLRSVMYFSMDHYWPVSIFLPKYPVWQDIPVLVGIACLWVAFIKAWPLKKPLWVYVVLASVLIVATNLLQGPSAGLRQPIIGEGRHDEHYWHDASKISSVGNFLQTFTLVQPKLRTHSRTHPPGPLLFIHLIRSVSSSPMFLAALILGVGSVSAFFLYDIALHQYNTSLARLTGMLLLFVPATQIYFWSSIDTLILSLFLATYWAWIKNKAAWAILGLGLAAFFTFAVIWLIPVLVFDEWRRYRTIHRALFLVLAVVALYLGINYLTGFNYWQSFQIARSIESPGSISEMLRTLSYYSSRMEDILEILIFLGPFLTYLVYKGIQQGISIRAYNQPVATSIVAICLLLGVFASGAYFTGETARAAMYIYPFLLLVVAFYLQGKNTTRTQIVLMTLVFCQSLLMQLFGWYGW